jgi:hypothetical protein
MLIIWDSAADRRRNILDRLHHFLAPGLRVLRRASCRAYLAVDRSFPVRLLDHYGTVGPLVHKGTAVPSTSPAL